MPYSFYHLEIFNSESLISKHDVDLHNPYDSVFFKNVKSDSSYDFIVDYIYSCPFLFSSSKTSSLPFSFTLNTPQDDFSLDLYPASLRCENSSFFFYERKPFKATVLYKNGPAHSSARQSSYSFWVPWTIYAVSKSRSYDVYIFFSDKQLENIEDFYLFNVFPNSFSDGKICLGMSSDILSTSFDMGKRVRFESFINDYWSGSWNNDLSSIFHYLFPRSASSFDDSKYPLLSSYVNFSDDILLRFRNNFNSSRFKYLNKSRNLLNFYYDSSRNSYLRILSYLSVLSLEETLQFFKELKEYAVENSFSNVSKFSNLIRNTHSSDSTSYLDSSTSLLNSLFSPSNVNTENSVPSYDDTYLLSFVFDEDFLNNSLSSDSFFAENSSFTTAQSLREGNSFSLDYYQHRKNNLYLRKDNSNNIYPILFDSSNFGNLLFIVNKSDSAKVVFKVSFEKLLSTVSSVIENEDYTDNTYLTKYSPHNSQFYGYSNLLDCYSRALSHHPTISQENMYSSLYKNLFTSFCNFIFFDLEYYFNKYFLSDSEDTSFSSFFPEKLYF
jgi:hypothetical protein